MTDSLQNTPNKAEPKSRTDDNVAPGLLISVPEMNDPNFVRSVILMVEHNAEGAMGLVVNHPSTATFDQLCADQGIQTQREDLIYVGGPVGQDRVWLIHHPQEELKDSIALTSEIVVSFTVEALGKVAEKEKEEVITCAGYAGWGPGQLEEELSAGIWLYLPVSTELLFSADLDALWERLIVQFVNFNKATLAPGSSSDMN